MPDVRRMPDTFRICTEACRLGPQASDALLPSFG